MLKLWLWKKQLTLKRESPKNYLTGHLTDLKGWFLEEGRQPLDRREVWVDTANDFSFKQTP